MPLTTVYIPRGACRLLQAPPRSLDGEDGTPQPMTVPAFGYLPPRPRVPLRFGDAVTQRIRHTVRLQRNALALLIGALPAVLAQVVVAVAVGLRWIDPVPIDILPTLVAFSLLAANRLVAGRAVRLRPPQYPVASRGGVVAVAGLDAEAARVWADRNAGLGLTVRTR